MGQRSLHPKMERRRQVIASFSSTASSSYQEALPWMSAIITLSRHCQLKPWPGA